MKPAPAAPLDVSVVLPCLNEAASVGLTVTEALREIAAAGLHGEVVVADNGSTDGSQQIAEQAGARVIHQSIRGYGAAISAGIAAAVGTVVVMADADMTYPFEFIGQLVRPVLDDEVDMMIGARWSGASTPMPFLHRFVGTPVLTWLVRRAGGPAGLSDSQSGFRAFRRDKITALNLRSTGMEYASEMFIVAGRAGWRMREIAAGYRERIGESKLDTWSDGWRHIKTIILLAPDLLGIYPGLALFALGALLLAFSFLDRGLFVLGSPGWLAAFLGPACLVLGTQAIVTGLTISARSPLGRHGRTERLLTSEASLHNTAVLGVWMIGVGIVIDATLLTSWLFALGAPFVSLPLAGLGQALLLIGGSLLGYGLLASIILAGQRRWGEQSTAPTADAAREDSDGLAVATASH